MLYADANWFVVIITPFFFFFIATINNTTNNPCCICVYFYKVSLHEKTIPKKAKALDFIGLQGNSLEEQGQAFLAQTRGGAVEGENNNNINQYWAEDNILLFLDFHKQPVIRKELAAGTLGAF